MKDIIYNKAHLSGVYLSPHNSKNCFILKENSPNAKCKEVNLVGFESADATFGFKLDMKGTTKISPYFENKKGLDKGNDGIVFTTIANKRYVFICELKDGGRGHIAQFKSTSCFIDYLKSILKQFHHIDTSDLIFKYIVFSKDGRVSQNTSGRYISRNIDGLDVFNMQCCSKAEYYIESFI
ncbi:MAG: hypothetical protein WA010_08360 [Sulfuricurvum sp.]